MNRGEFKARELGTEDFKNNSVQLFSDSLAKAVKMAKFHTSLGLS